MANIDKSQKDKAFGSVIGAFVGDAAGAYLEFFKGQITERDVEVALLMKGGGGLLVGAGQITDDSEMAMCLLNAIANKPKEKGIYSINIDQIGYNYYQWSKSSPFDIGRTTSKAFTAVNAEFYTEENPRNRRLITDLIFQSVWEHNKHSLSNGCLMRITPLAVWGHKLPKKNLLHSVAFQTCLTHCNPTVIFAAISQLIQKPNDAKNAFTNTLEEVDQVYKEYPKLSDDLRNWMDEVTDEKCQLPDTKIQKGQAKIAFQYAFRDLHMYSKNQFQLHSHTSQEIQLQKLEQLMQAKLSKYDIMSKSYQKIQYEYSLRSILIQNGDTDTNACIVGGLIGALVGQSNINQYWIDKLLSYDFYTLNGSQEGHKRPEAYSPKKNLMHNLEILYENATKYNPEKDRFQMTIFRQNYSNDGEIDELLDNYLQLKFKRQNELKFI